jgi:predicted transcriptional regulator of viral defense system
VGIRGSIRRAYPRIVGVAQQADGVDRRVAEISGVTTAAGLRAAGLSARQIHRLTSDGTLRWLRTGVYAPAALADSVAGEPAAAHLLQVAAAIAAASSPAVGSHRSAAIVHGLSLVGQQPVSRVELTRARAGPGSKSRRPGILLHMAALPAGQVTRCRGVPVTSVARTVVDLARTVPFAEGVAVADSALRDNRATRGELETVLARCARWPGIQLARRVVAFADPLAESVLESISRAAFHEHGLPPPELQVWVGDEDGVAGRVDFLWRQYRTVAEADGAIKYTRPAQAMAQLNRDARLRAAGFEVVHFTWPEITRVPGQVVAAVHAAFRRGGTRRGGPAS